MATLGRTVKKPAVVRLAGTAEACVVQSNQGEVDAGSNMDPKIILLCNRIQTLFCTKTESAREHSLLSTKCNDESMITELEQELQSD